MSKKVNLDAMSIDEMWQLHEEIIRVLSTRLTSEKRALEKRLSQLSREKGEIAQSDPPDLEVEEWCVRRATEISEGISKIPKSK